MSDLSAMAAGMLMKLKEECEAQHAESASLRAQLQAAEQRIAEAAVNCPSCGRHDFGLIGPLIKQMREAKDQVAQWEQTCDGLLTRAEKAEQERDALREALARIVRGYDGPTVDIGTAVSAAIPAARALLAEPPT